MHPLCVCMSTSQELCWWQMVMSAQKVLCFSGFLAVDCFLKSIFLKTRTKNVSFCFSNYNTRGSALGQNCMNCWCRTLSCASKAGLHDIPSKAVKLCSYMYIWRIHHNMTNQCENFLRFVDDESNIFLQSKFHASAALGKWNSWKLYVFI